MESVQSDGRALFARVGAAVSAAPGEHRLLAVGALYQIVLRMRTYYVSYDYACLLSSAMNFLRRGQFANLRVNSQDLGVVFQRAITHWPPGFSAIVAALTVILRTPYRAMVAYDVISMALFFSACARLLWLMGANLPRRARWLFAFTVTFVAPSYIDYFTNITSLAFLLWAIALTLPDRNGRAPSVSSCGVAGVLLGATIGFRYAAAPASVMPIAVLAMAALRDPNERRCLAAAVGGWMAGVAPLVLWSVFIAGSSGLGPIRATHGWYPGSLARFHAFGADAIFGNFATMYFPRSTYHRGSIVKTAQFQIRHLISALIVLGAFAGVCELIGASRTSPEGAIIRRIFAAGVAASAITIAMLVYLTLRNAPDAALNGWVYVEEDRYFGLCLPFVLFGAAYLAAVPARWWASRLLKGVILASFLVGGGLWARALPGVVNAVRRGRWGGPMESHFLNSPTFVEDFQKLIVPGEPSVALEFGMNGSRSWLREAYISYLDLPSTIVWGEQPIHTSRDVVVLAFVDRNETPDHRNAFEKFCRERRGSRLSMRDYDACRVEMKSGT